MSEGMPPATVAIIGAGPTGLFAARELACNGIGSVLFNRDIKPGGLAEYGIYPEKYRLKDGMRMQFKEILNNPNITYFGNVTIGVDQALSLQDLRALGFAAVLVTCGAQGTKWLGLPGEKAAGVYHAKEVVYHYNHLPPYASQELKIGKRAVVVGVGNVMADIVRYLSTLPQVEEITTIARRGLAEVKFEKKELEPIIGHLDVEDFHAEVERISAPMKWICQVPNEEAESILTTYNECPQKALKPIWRLHFLYSPARILTNAQNEVSGIQLEQNSLELHDGEVRAKGSGQLSELPADTIIFAIGDKVNSELGLPMQGIEYAKNPAPLFPIEGNSYEIFDTAHPENEKGIFVAGWARKPSTGLVGLARKDGTYAARAIVNYLQAEPNGHNVDRSGLEMLLHQKGYAPVTTSLLQLLDAAEKEQAALLNLPEFKFDTNEEMLKRMKLT